MTMKSHLTPALLAVLFGATLFTSCEKEKEAVVPVPPSNMTLLLEHHVDGEPLLYDSLKYTNEAGHGWSVNRLEYYVSEIILHGAGGTPDDTIHGPYLVNGEGAHAFDLGQLTAGSYSGASLLLGLPPSLNTTGALPNTLANLNMAWPEPMGGGYHFIKFEGHFMNGMTPSGFAMHVGKDVYLPHCELPQPFTLDGGSGTLAMRFNLNEMFRTPNTYDLSNGNYSMGNMVLMGQLRDNCADAFSIEYRP